MSYIRAAAMTDIIVCPRGTWDGPKVFPTCRCINGCFFFFFTNMTNIAPSNVKEAVFDLPRVSCPVIFMATFDSAVSCPAGGVAALGQVMKL